MRNAGFVVPSERGCAGAASAMFNVVVVVEWLPHVVVRGFYTVASIVAPNQTRALSSPQDSTSLHVVVVVVSGVSKKETDLPVEVNPDHYEYVEDAKALAPFTHQKYPALV